MSQALGSLLVDIGASTARLEKDFAKARKDLDTFGKSAIASAKHIGMAIGGALTVSAFTAMVKTSLDAADNMGKLSQKVGVATETLSGYSHAASLSDVTMESLGTALGKLDKNMLDMVRGTGEAKKSFEDLGIQVSNADGSLKSADEVLAEVADRFAGMEDGAAKTALAMGIFGKAGKDMIPMLNAGSAGLKEMKDEAARMGLIMSKETAQAAERVNDNFTRLQGAIAGARNQVVFGALPAFEKISEAFITTSDNSKKLELAGKALNTALKIGASIAIGTATAFEVVGSRVGAVAAALYEAGQGNFKNAFKIISESNKDIAKSSAESWGTIQKLWDDAAAAPALGVVKTNILEIAAAEKLAAEEAKKLADKRAKEADARRKQLISEGNSAGNSTPDDAWMMQEKDKWDVHSREFDIMLEREKTAEAERAALYEGGTDFWLLKEQEKWEVHSRTGQMIADEEEKNYAAMQNAVAGWASNFSGTLTDMVFGAKASFADILESFAKMITQMMIQRAIVEPLLGKFGLTANAKGNVFAGGKVQAFANGGIVNKPTIFPMANGAGLMGEAGPEAIMPLKRGKDGRLGVEGGSGGTVVQVMVNNAPAKVREERSNSGGKELVKIFIDAVDEAIGSGRMDKTFNRTFGLQRGGTR